MSVEKSWHRPWVCKDGRCKRHPIGTSVFVLQCDHCGMVISVTCQGPADLELETGWTILDDGECYCRRCK